MNPFILFALAAALILTACGGNTSVPAPTVKTTKYQGVWAWGIGDSSGNLIESGAVAYGAYANDLRSRLGYTLMGPISATSKLDVGFTVDTNTSNPAVYFVGQDSDNVMGTYQGKPAFSGSGAIVDANGNPGQTVVVALIQMSTVVPTSANAQAAAKQNAAAQMTAYAATRSPQVQAMKTSPATLRNAATALLNR